MARMKHGAACPEAERPFASDAARLDPGPANAQPNAGAEEPPTSWRETGETQSQSRRQRQGTVLFLSYVEEQKLRFQGGSHPGPHAHPPEPAVSGTVNRAGPVTDRDTRRNFFLIPLDVS